MKRLFFLLIISTVCCSLLTSCEDERTKYLTIGIFDGMVSVKDEYKNQIQYATIESKLYDITVIGISAYGFSNCKNLKELTINEGPTIIKEYAFDKCEQLYRIHISKSISSIGEYAFNDCLKLKLIFYNGTKEEWNKISKGTNWKDLERTCTIYYADETYELL